MRENILEAWEQQEHGQREARAQSRGAVWGRSRLEVGRVCPRDWGKLQGGGGSDLEKVLVCHLRQRQEDLV